MSLSAVYFDADACPMELHRIAVLRLPVIVFLLNTGLILICFCPR